MLPEKISDLPILSLFFFFAYRRRRITPKSNSILWLLPLFVIYQRGRASGWTRDGVNKKLIERGNKNMFNLTKIEFL